MCVTPHGHKKTMPGFQAEEKKWKIKEPDSAYLFRGCLGNPTRNIDFHLIGPQPDLRASMPPQTNLCSVGNKENIRMILWATKSTCYPWTLSSSLYF